MAISGSAGFLMPGNVFISTLILCSVLVLVNITCVLSWAGFGAFMSRYLQHKAARRSFNLTMAGLLLLCVPLVFF